MGRTTSLMIGPVTKRHEKGALRRTLLAYTPEKRQDQIVAQAMQNDQKHRPDISLIKRELKTIRARSYAESEAEVTPDLWGVAVPIFCNSVADTVLVMLAPGYRVSRTERARLRSAVLAAPQEISDRITYRPIGDRTDAMALCSAIACPTPEAPIPPRSTHATETQAYSSPSLLQRSRHCS